MVSILIQKECENKKIKTLSYDFLVPGKVAIQFFVIDVKHFIFLNTIIETLTFQEMLGQKLFVNGETMKAG